MGKLYPSWWIKLCIEYRIGELLTKLCYSWYYTIIFQETIDKGGSNGCRMTRHFLFNVYIRCCNLLIISINQIGF
jgi:hypothetical protein